MKIIIINSEHNCNPYLLFGTLHNVTFTMFIRLFDLVFSMFLVN